MSISFLCPACGKSIKAPDHAAGKRGRCPACKTAATVPMPEVQPEEDVGYEVVDEEPVAEPSDVPVASQSSGWQATRGSELGYGGSSDRGFKSSTRSKVYRSRPVRKKGRDRLYWVLIIALVPL